MLKTLSKVEGKKEKPESWILPLGGEWRIRRHDSLNTVVERLTQFEAGVFAGKPYPAGERWEIQEYYPVLGMARRTT